MDEGRQWAIVWAERSPIKRMVVGPGGKLDLADVKAALCGDLLEGRDNLRVELRAGATA